MSIVTEQQIEQFKAMEKQYQDLQDKRAQLFDELFQPGTTVYWRHHGHVQYGYVKYRRNYNDFLDLHVENSKTGKVVKVTLFDISWEHMKSQAEEFNKLVADLDSVLTESEPA